VGTFRRAGDGRLGSPAALAASVAVAALTAMAGPAAAVPAGPVPTPPASRPGPAVPAAPFPATPVNPVTPVTPVTVEQAEAQLDTAYRRAEVAAETVNAAAATAAATAADVANARTAATVQQRAAARLRAAVGNEAAASYRAGGLGLTTRFLLADNADEFLQSASTTRTVRDGQERQLAALQRQVVRVRGEQARVVAAGRVAEQVSPRRAVEKAALDREVTAARAVLGRLSATQRGELAARAAAAAVADRALARVLLAQARAELSLPVASRAGTGASTGPVAGYDSSGAGGSPDAGSNSRVPDGGGADSTVPDIGVVPGSPPVAGVPGSPPLAGVPGSPPVASVPGSPPIPVVDNARVARVLAYAAAKLGDRYIWGATGPDAFDCSGLVLRAWQQAGITLPRTASVQATAGRPVARADLRPGDLVFFYSPVSHIGLYIGGGKMINAANPRTGVRVANVDTPAYAGAVRPG
jgi:hypothetical protein